jgi:hypothetical protein
MVKPEQAMVGDSGKSPALFMPSPRAGIKTLNTMGYAPLDGSIVTGVEVKMI